MVGENHAHNISPSHCIDPKSALNPPEHELFGNGAFLSSSQTSDPDRVQQAQAESGFPSAIIPQRDFSFSSCDEDADGEPDESYHSEHSFWMTHPGDISTSTVATTDIDEPPIPLLSRDGTWKGMQTQTVAGQQDKDGNTSARGDDSQQQGPLTSENGTTDPTRLYSTPLRCSRQKGASSVSESAFGDTSHPDGKKRGNEAEEDVLELDESSRSASQLKQAHKRQSKRLRSNIKAARGIDTAPRSDRSDKPASSDDGSVGSTSSNSSPASSSRRFKLRKKDSVPKRSLTALLTPPHDVRASSPRRDWVSNVHGESSAGVRDTQTSPKKRDETSSAHELGPGDTSEEWDQLEETPHSSRPEQGREKGVRIFPAGWEMHPEFPLLYQRYNVPSSVSPEVLEMLLRGLNHTSIDNELHEIIDRAQSVQGTFNRPRSILDLYTPRFVKGVGSQKVGMCPVCYEAGKIKFLKTKFSAYNYHLQNYHGVSALTGLPFTPPSKFRVRARSNAKPKERKKLVQGLCHSCNKYIDIQGPKETEVKVAEIYWWKHAQVCHRKAAVPDGVGGYFVENQWFERVCNVLELLGGFDGEVGKLLAGNK